MTLSYLPLGIVWPDSVPRTQPARRVPGPYRAGFTQTAGELDDLCSNWKVCGPVEIGTDLVIGPRGGINRAVSDDPGVAVRFARGPASFVLALDRYSYVDHNLRGIFLCLQGLRRIERDGTAQLFEQMLHGFQALPAPKRWPRLGLDADASAEDVKAAFRERAQNAHPDRGGDPAAFHLLAEERDAALQAAGSRA